jgi:hypothetical protein
MHLHNVPSITLRMGEQALRNIVCSISPIDNELPDRFGDDHRRAVPRPYHQRVQALGDPAGKMLYPSWTSVYHNLTPLE